MKTSPFMKWLCLIMLLQLIALFGNGQAYEQLDIKEYYDDQEEYQTDPSLFTPLNSCAKAGGLLEGMASKLESLIRMYKTTGDKAYLYKCIKQIQLIQSLRGTYSGPYDCMPNTFNHGSLYWAPYFYINGLLIWPMSHLVHLIRIEEPDLQTVSLNPHLSLDLSSNDYANFGQFANWLAGRVNETLTSATDNYWYGDDKGFGDHINPEPRDAPMEMNLQSGFSASLLYLGLAWNSNHLTYARIMVELYKGDVDIEDKCASFLCNPINYQHPVLRIRGTTNGYFWYHQGWRVTFRDCQNICPLTFQPNFFKFSEFYEDVSHGAQDLIFPFIAHRFNLSSNNIIHFTDAEMTRFRNTFAKHIWKGQLNFSDEFNNTVFGDNSPVPDDRPENYFHQWSLNWMPLYKYDDFDNAPKPLYDIIMDYYTNTIHGNGPNQHHLFNNRLLIYWGLSEVVAAQWDKECTGLTLKNRQVVYDQDFFAKDVLTIDAFAPNDFDGSDNSFANPIITEDKFTIEPGINVHMTAGTEIVFEPGFESYGEMVAEIDPDLNCNGGGNKWDGNQSSNTESIAVDTHTTPEAEVEESAEPAGHFAIYPNPNSGQFTLTLPNEANAIAQVYDVLGNLIHKSQIPNSKSQTIDISEHPKGIYLVRVVQADKIFTQKLIHR